MTSLDAVVRRLHRSGPMFGAGWSEAAMPNWLRQLTFETAEGFYHQGVISQAGWEAYCHVWRTGAPRFSSVAVHAEAPPTDPEVIELVSILRQELR